jgi:hypothetical protein
MFGSSASVSMDGARGLCRVGGGGGGGVTDGETCCRLLFLTGGAAVRAHRVVLVDLLVAFLLLEGLGTITKKNAGRGGQEG